MANKLKLRTKDETLRDLLGSGKKYVVPKFQRDYSWEQAHWQDLWEDIKILRQNPDDYHYMGYLVLQGLGKDEMQFKVIDGQQRLTTFSLLVLASIKRLKDIGNKQERIAELQKNFIASNDALGLTILYLSPRSSGTLKHEPDIVISIGVFNLYSRIFGLKHTKHLIDKALTDSRYTSKI